MKNRFVAVRFVNFKRKYAIQSLKSISIRISVSLRKKKCDWNTVDGDIQTLQFWPRNFLVHLGVELYILIELTRKWVQGSEKQRGYTRNSAKSGGVRIKYEASKELNCKRVMSQKIYMTENNFFFLATTKSKSKEKSKRY